ncbi:hypothetical protein AB0B66_10485 [Catellatospora sp. NPDC049111]|uniref:hypothetical protein n=1 Tax=Catellatospora sp. NPDC049111 TaxID=3155271 RepID=UPI0033D31F7F
MSRTIRVSFNLDVETLARIITIADVPGPSRAAVRAAVIEVLTQHGIDGAMRRYRHRRGQLTDPADLVRLDNVLAENRILAQRLFPTPTPRPHRERPEPVGRPLLDVLAEVPDNT